MMATFPAESVALIQVPRAYTYSTVYHKPRDAKPYMLFLHGFPESAYDWTHQIAFFQEKGYGILAPDLLGYGDSSKPQDCSAYRFKQMIDDIIGILDHRQIDRVVAIGHDWGCMVLSGLAAWYPSRITAYAFLAVGYTRPARFDAAAANSMTKEHFGYEAFGYFSFLADEDSATLLDANPDSANSLFFSEENPRHWPEEVCPPGAARAWIEAGRTEPLPPWLSDEVNSKRQALLRSGGYRGPTNWYRQAVQDFNDEDAKTIPPENDGIKDKPVLYLRNTKPSGAMPTEAIVGMMKQACKDITVAEVDAGHFLMLEAPDAVNKALHDFLVKKV